jgi:cytochrome c oxidase subunit 1
VFGYKFMTWSMLAIAVIGFMVWGHHMFVSGMSVYAAMAFSLLSFVVAVPSAIKIFNWTATLRKGDIRFTAPMLYALGFVGLFLLGGLTGLILAAPALDEFLHDTYFVIAHFHYVMVGGSVMAYLGGIHFWWPKVTGRLYSEKLAKFAAILMFVGFNVTFFPQYLLGYEGMPRRYHSYLPRFQELNIISSGGAVLLAISYTLPVLYLLWSLKYGKKAPANPWDARGLEWQTSSPPPKENFLHPPVPREAYAYDQPAP